MIKNSIKLVSELNWIIDTLLFSKDYDKALQSPSGDANLIYEQLNFSGYLFRITMEPHNHPVVMQISFTNN